MQEDYSFGDENELDLMSDDDLYLKHVIGEDIDLHSLNGLVANYFSNFDHAN